MVRGQLKSLETVGQILDFLSFSIQMLFVEKPLTTTDLMLLNDIFQIMPVLWESDPVKVSLANVNVQPFPRAISARALHCVTFNYEPLLSNIFTGSFGHKNNL